MKTLRNLKAGDTIETINGTAIVSAFTSFGTRRGDIRKEVREAEIEYPILRGTKNSFIGYVTIVPEEVNMLYAGEAKESFILNS